MSKQFYNAKNLTIGNGFVKNPDRYYLEEYFKQRPALNADIDQVHTVEVARAANKDFEVQGTNMTTALCTFDSNRAGILLTTAGADQDQAIVAPHLDTNQSAWTGVKFGSENQIEWECAISIPAITDVKVWAGLKLTNDQLISTDDNQLFFKFQTDATNSETFTDFTKLHFVLSVGGTEYVSQLPITVAADTIYKLRISIDSSRFASIFVNGVQYNISAVAGTAGTAVVAGGIPSIALTDDTDFIPYIGVEAGAASAKSVNVYYEKISRVLFE